MRGFSEIEYSFLQHTRAQGLGNFYQNLPLLVRPSLSLRERKVQTARAKAGGSRTEFRQYAC